MPKTISQELEAQNSKLTATEWCLWQVKCVMVECWVMAVGLQTFVEKLRTITSILFKEYQPNSFWDKVSFLPSCLPLMQRRRQHSGTLDILNIALLQSLLYFSSWNWDKNNRVFPRKLIPNPAGGPSGLTPLEKVFQAEFSLGCKAFYCRCAVSIKIQYQQSNWPSRSSGYKLLLSCLSLKIHQSASDLATPIIPVLHITALILPLNVLSPLAVTWVSASFHVTTTLSHRAKTQRLRWLQKKACSGFCWHMR